jgi:hypothetical protein
MFPNKKSCLCLSSLSDSLNLGADPQYGNALTYWGSGTFFSFSNREELSNEDY